MNGDVKGFFESKTIWGALIAGAASILALGHYTLGASDQQALVDLITGIPGIVGSILAIYGRVVASKKIG